MARFQVTAMDHIVLNVADVERSVAFYVEVLGLGAERVDEFRAGQVMFPSVRINEACLIDLMTAEQDTSAQARTNLNHYCLVAEGLDFESLIDDLKQAGVTVLRGPVSRWGARGDARSVYILDPDANEVEIRSY